MNILIALSIPLFSFLLIHYLKIVSIFFLMRLFSAYSNRKRISSLWHLISYLIYIPEMITGPHRNIAEWTSPQFLYKKINLNNSIRFIIYLNLILFSGLIYSFLINRTNINLLLAAITHLCLYIQFMSSCEIINIINLIFGQKQIINFNNPLCSESITDFWLRWHITLGNFTRQYISQPLTFLLRKKGLKNLLAFTISTTISFIFIGLWHKISFGYFYFGIYFAVIVLFEKTHIYKSFKEIIPKQMYRIISITYSQFFIILGYTFVIDDLKNVIIHP